MQFDRELDARGLQCPLPIVKTKKQLNEMASGQVLRVVSTDVGSLKDMEAFAEQTGNALLSTETLGKEFVFFLRRK
ncbi:MAG TPA: sulfurtransferase TusA family protein [Burkholderiaceae bacterium]|nr:sulfurtransferase TusA family protein [Burkholderiaceae bacterium]